MPKRAVSKTFEYRQDWKTIDFRRHPEKYQVGIGEQGVLLVEPYKSEILPHWRFRTPEIAEQSAKQIYRLFQAYKRQDDFVGMDMARKFLQMGYTRSRRYANHPGGTKYAGKKPKDGAPRTKRKVLPQAADWATSPKAQSARIFYGYYLKAREDAKYRRLKAAHQAQEKASRGKGPVLAPGTTSRPPAMAQEKMKSGKRSAAVKTRGRVSAATRRRRRRRSRPRRPRCMRSRRRRRSRRRS